MLLQVQVLQLKIVLTVVLGRALLLVVVVVMMTAFYAKLVRILMEMLSLHVPPAPMENILHQTVLNA